VGGDFVAETKKKEVRQLHGSPIEDYSMIGDCDRLAMLAVFSGAGEFCGVAGNAGSRFLADCTEGEGESNSA
jgi:hypothetical protein